MMPQNTRTVFVANIPYDVSEEQIANVFSEVGPVSNVEIKFDPQTGKSKGYAFVQFYDEAAAQSAMRNLQEVPINGRPVRIELSNDERAGGGGGGGGGARRPGPPPGAFGRPGARDVTPPRGWAGDIDMSLLPPGQDPPPGQKATDAITKTLAEVNPGQMQEVMAGMKSLITTNPDQARDLLSNRPQLAYALFQAMLLMNIIDPSVLQRIQPLPPTGAPAAAPGYPAYPPQQRAPAPQEAYYPPPQAAAQPPFRPAPPAAYTAPPPAPAPAPAYGGYPARPAPAPAAPPPLPPATQAALAGLPEDQRNMLMQVLQLTPDQINALDPEQQGSVRQLRAQFLGAGA